MPFVLDVTLNLSTLKMIDNILRQEDKSRLMQVLWTVTSSLTKRARPRRDHVDFCLR